MSNVIALFRTQCDDVTRIFDVAKELNDIRQYESSHVSLVETGWPGNSYEAILFYQKEDQGHVAWLSHYLVTSFQQSLKERYQEETVKDIDFDDDSLDEEIEALLSEIESDIGPVESVMTGVYTFPIDGVGGVSRDRFLKVWKKRIKNEIIQEDGGTYLVTKLDGIIVDRVALMDIPTS